MYSQILKTRHEAVRTGFLTEFLIKIGRAAHITLDRRIESRIKIGLYIVVFAAWIPLWLYSMSVLISDLSAEFKVLF
jgi:hypothetical protein